MQGTGQNVPFRFTRKLLGCLFALSAVQTVTSSTRIPAETAACGAARSVPACGHLPPSPAKPLALQICASLCNADSASKRWVWSGRGKRRMILRLLPTLSCLEVALPLAGSLLISGVCLLPAAYPGGSWEGRLWSS